MRKIPVLSGLLLASFTIILSCSKNGNDNPHATLDCSTITNKAFAADVSPTIQARCNVPSCHAAGSVNGPGPLTNYAQVSAAASAIRSAISSGLMPQDGPLTTTQKNALLCWIDSGAPNN